MAYTILNMADSIEDPTDKWPQSEPDARDFGDILGASLGLTGVVSGCEVTAQGTPDMTVAVASGVAIVGGTSATVTAGNVTITAAGAQPRFDLVCVSSAGVKSAVLGTGATNPVFPDPGGKAVLAAVYVPGSDTDIDANQIVDKRVMIKPWTQLSGDTMTGNLVLLKSASETMLEAQGSTQSATVRISAWGDTGTATPLPMLLLRRMRGTIAAPLRTKSTDLMGRVGGTGAHAASDVAAATLLTTAMSQIEFRAAEDFTSTARGTNMRFFTTPLLSVAPAERMRILPDGELQLDDTQGYASPKSGKIALSLASTNRTATLSGNRGAIYARVARYGSGTTTDSDQGVYALAQHHASVSSAAITNVANNGSGLIRITTGTAHGFTTGDRVGVGFVGGVTAANAVWTVTVINTTTFDCQGSTFSGVYTSGGYASTAGAICGVFSYISMVTPRTLSGAIGGALDADDVSGVIVFNGSSVPYSGTTAFYQGTNSTTFNDTGEYEWGSGYDTAAYNQYWCYGGTGRIGANGAWFDAARGTYDSGATWLRAPKNIYALFTEVDGVSSPINFAKYDTSAAAITFGAKIALPDVDVVLGTATGSKIGTATAQKLAFHNSTPVIQKASAAQAAVATTGAVNTTPYGYTTAAQADAIVTLVNEEPRAALVEKGLIKGAA